MEKTQKIELENHVQSTVMICAKYIIQTIRLGKVSIVDVFDQSTA